MRSQKFKLGIKGKEAYAFLYWVAQSLQCRASGEADTDVFPMGKNCFLSMGTPDWRTERGPLLESPFRCPYNETLHW